MSRSSFSGGETPSLFGLAPCGVCPARSITAAAVRSYRTFSPLPRAPQSGPAKAVYFLWHFPSVGLHADFPDVIRHTALWSSDFPPAFPDENTGDRPVQLPTFSLYSMSADQAVGTTPRGSKRDTP